MSSDIMPIRVFCSYVSKDKPLLEEMEVHLSVLRRQELILTWHRGEIAPGTNKAEAIDEWVERASVILLLISPDYLALNLSYETEMQRALERHEAGQARVVPLIIRPCDWQHSLIGHLQALPLNAHPVSLWANRDEAWVQVTTNLRRVIKDLSQLPIQRFAIANYIRQLEILKKLEDKRLIRDEVVTKFQEGIVAKILDETVLEMSMEVKRSTPVSLVTGDFSSLRKKIFICYSHKDKKWWEKINIALQPLLRKELLNLWVDTQIKPGDRWQEEIERTLKNAKVAVLLVSQNFLASDFIIQHELPSLLNAAQQQGLTVLWLAISDSLYAETDIVLYQALNDPSCPLDCLSPAALNRELVKICKEIKRFGS